jgi:hypothetical protein
MADRFQPMQIHAHLPLLRRSPSYVLRDLHWLWTYHGQTGNYQSSKPIVRLGRVFETQLVRISATAYKFGWLQASQKLLKGKKFWLRGVDLNHRPLGYERLDAAGNDKESLKRH